jgi:4,4'-diaponeurosporenoate glycosyltransferase
VGALPVDGLLSVQPYQATGRLHEGLSMFCNVVTTMSTNAFTPLGDHVAPRVAFGSCLVTTRDAYDAVGGHASVAGNVVDEVALARRYRAAGRPVVCRGGRGTLSCRNPGGPRQLVKGWSKNLAVEMASANVFTALLAVVWLSVCAFAVWSLIASPSWASFALYIAIVVELAWMARRLGRFARSIVAFYPVALALFLVVLLCSLFVTVIRRRVNWKGRTVSVRPSA